MKLFAIIVMLMSFAVAKESEKMIYDFEMQTIEGKMVSLSEYRGKVILIVNVASKCGFTPQYEGLELLYDIYKDQGFIILGFPCNQFANQEPKEGEEILQFCQTTYDVSFPMFAKIKVNGKDASALYKYLKKEQSGFLTNDIKWNFTKFLVNQKGEVIQRYGSSTKPKEISPDIEKLLTP